MENIERLTIKDLDDVYNFEKICFPNNYTSREYWIELLEDERTFVFVIKENGAIKAYISIYNWKGERDLIKIMGIGTHPDHRKNGYAHILMQYIIDEMLKDDMHIFRAETRKTNYKMQKVFEDFGYKIINEVEGYYDNPTETALKYALEV